MNMRGQTGVTSRSAKKGQRYPQNTSSSRKAQNRPLAHSPQKQPAPVTLVLGLSGTGKQYSSFPLLMPARVWCFASQPGKLIRGGSSRNLMKIQCPKDQSGLRNNQMKPSRCKELDSTRNYFSESPFLMMIKKGEHWCREHHKSQRTSSVC